MNRPRFASSWPALLLVTTIAITRASLALAAGATFHVSTTGNDTTGDGSVAAPWATISHAVDTVPDESTVLVAAGTYHGRVDLRGRFDLGVTVRSEVPYRARLRHDGTVVTCFYGKGITLEGFDIAHDGPGAAALVMQVSDLIDDPMGIEKISDVTVRANTIVGDQPALEYGFRIVTVGASPASDGLFVHNNIWSDPTGTMGATFNRGGATVNLAFDHNLFWNDGNAFPTSSESIVEVADDANAILGDPLLPDPASAPLPRWNEGTGTFGDGSTTIAGVFENLVLDHAAPAAGSPALDAADAANMPADDILGRPRSEGGAPDVGAFETPSCVGVADGETCDDGNDCTGNDQCLAEACTGDPVPLNGTGCDDSNPCTAGDQCNAGTCAGNAAAADGQACDNGDPCTHADTCASGSCTTSPGPLAGCAEATRGGLDIRERLTWNWEGTGVAVGDFGDPTSATTYRLCLYDRELGVASVAGSTSAPAGGQCGSRNCWKAKPGKGFQYTDRAGTPDGTTKLKLSATAAGTGKIKLTAGGAALTVPGLPLLQDTDVVAQLLSSNADCWQTTLEAPALDNDASRFRDSR